MRGRSYPACAVGLLVAVAACGSRSTGLAPRDGVAVEGGAGDGAATDGGAGDGTAVVVDDAGIATRSGFALGVTLTQYDLDPASDPIALAGAEKLLSASTVYMNQHIMGWGADNPEPSPGVYDFSTLDDRVALIRASGGVPVITLCCAPDWMKGGTPGTTDWSMLEVAPLPTHFADFAALAAAVARRYPDVKHFQVWNELKGFWNATLNRWDYEGYTALYNDVYDALEAVSPDIQVGGPYVVMDNNPSHSSSHPSALTGAYGTVDQRSLDVVTYWLANRHGAGFLCVDGGGWYTGVADPFAANQFYTDVDAWLRARTSLPIWWSEWYVTDWGASTYDHATQDAIMAMGEMRMIESGVAVALRWQPQGDAATPYMGDQESLWSDTRVAGGGQPFPYYGTAVALKGAFAVGTPLAFTLSTAALEMLGSPGATLVVNKQATTATAHLAGSAVTLAPHEVRLVTTPCTASTCGP